METYEFSQPNYEKIPALESIREIYPDFMDIPLP